MRISLKQKNTQIQKLAKLKRFYRINLLWAKISREDHKDYPLAEKRIRKTDLFQNNI